MRLPRICNQFNINLFHQRKLRKKMIFHFQEAVECWTLVQITQVLKSERLMIQVVLEISLWALQEVSKNWIVTARRTWTAQCLQTYQRIIWGLGESLIYRLTWTAPKLALKWILLKTKLARPSRQSVKHQIKIILVKTPTFNLEKWWTTDKSKKIKKRTILIPKSNPLVAMMAPVKINHSCQEMMLILYG